MNKNIQILGHRGYSGRFTENSKQSFVEAFHLCHGIECDIQKCADEHFVIIHDPTTDRVADRPGKIAELTFNQLQKYRFEGGQTILDLSGLLELAPPGSIINIEIKEETITSDDVPAIVAAVKPYKEKVRIMFSSFEPDLLIGCRRGGFETGFLIGDEKRNNSIINIITTILRIKPTYCNLPVQMFEHLGLKKARFFIWILKKMVSGFIFWTVNTKIEYNLVKSYADMVITNEVEFMLKLTGIKK